ncbi:lantibiotic dehydratase C-terminal domain-containing protein [Streptomyces sp. NPDC015220]|uniref:lantibiotic dehydratase C-terminal domain-containing protein n=1 Tax=Streptomyces sp. NPDC015220 TaxID=3364947 RepID=UPI003700D9AF
MTIRQPPVGPVPEPADHWVGVHVFTGHPLDLVVRALVPGVLAELRDRDLIDRLFFLRHWQGGPHLRLRVRLTSPAAEPAARATLAAHTAAFFRALPPSQAMTEHQYDALAARLSAREPESEPGTLAPNDTFAFLPYRPEHAKYGHGAALRSAEDAFAICSELATDAVLAEWGPARRQAHCFALLAGSLDASAAAPVRPAPDVVARYRNRRAALLAVARAARTAAPEGAGGRAGADPVTRWLTACLDARRQAADPARLTGHLTHLACNRLGVRLDQEATLRGLALLAVAESTDGGPPPPPGAGHGGRRAGTGRGHPAHEGAGPG